MSTRWADSTEKHGISHSDALRAMRNPALHITEWDASRVPGNNKPDLFIGQGEGGEWIEVMAIVNRESRDVFVFHVMPLRKTVLDRAQQVLAERKKR